MVSQTAAPGAAFTSLSSNDAIQFLLGDIPIFTVGILAFGTLTFFFLMKRVDRWIFCLHISVLFAFLAALLDLSQLLVRGRDQATAGTDPEAGTKGLIQAREVFFSFANGLRFLFYWGFVAMIPLGETIPEGNTMHSGSWRRWGIIGAILKWASLIIVLLMTILQLAYRNVPSLEQIGPVYEAEATLEIILSAVFILKLLLNTWARYPVGSTTQSKGKMLVQYAPMIVALLFSLWIAVGNAILFEFTETALGRFMRAIELYIVIVYMLTISFHHLRHLSFFPIYRPATKGPSRANTFNRNSMEKSGDIYATNGVAAPQQVNNLMEVLEEQYRSAQAVPPTVERSSARSATVENANQHQSMVVRLSTWLGVARPLPRPPNPNTLQPWDVDTERGPSPVAQTTVEPWYAEENPRIQARGLSTQPEIDEDEQRGVSPLSYFPSRSLPERHSPSSVSSVSSAKEAPAALTVESDLESEKTSVPSRDWQEIEYSNAVRYSGVTEEVLASTLKQKFYQQEDESPIASNIQVVSPPTDDEVSRPGSVNSVKSAGGYLASPYPASPYPSSPIGSAAVTPLPRSRPLPPMPVARRVSMLASPMSPMQPDSARSSNMSILLRQQNELDQSIEALKKFSPSKQGFEVDAGPSTQTVYYAQISPEDLQQSARLSPAPTAPSPDLTLATPRADMIQSSAQSEFPVEHLPPLNRSSMDSNVIPPSLPVRDENIRSPTLAPPRMPISRFSDSSSVAERRERKGVDSMGTQYDITSFVGKLTVPVNPKDSIMSSSSGRFSEEGSVGVATVARPGFAQFARPTLITNVTRQEEPAKSASPVRRALPTIPQPIALAQLQSPQFQPSPSPPRFRRAVGLPARPRLSVTNNLTPVDERTTTMSPSDTATLVTSPPTGSGTPLTGKAW